MRLSVEVEQEGERSPAIHHRVRGQRRSLQRLETHILRWRWFYMVATPFWGVAALAAYLTYGICVWLYVSVVGFVVYGLYAIFGRKLYREMKHQRQTDEPEAKVTNHSHLAA